MGLSVATASHLLERTPLSYNLKENNVFYQATVFSLVKENGVGLTSFLTGYHKIKYPHCSFPGAMHFI
jgi:hypothetical protein